MRIRNYLFQKLKAIVKLYGYEEYDGPLIESLDIYRAKTGEEIVGKQIYSFVDKGNREVAIRPEMTPTVARMVAARMRDLPKPIRWFSIPNLWRYEQPGHGRLREHWQLNVDLFGVKDTKAELEILDLSCNILLGFGAKLGDFKVKISHRKILDAFLQRVLKSNPTQSLEIAKILDKKAKIEEDEFEALVKKVFPSQDDIIKHIETFLKLTKSDIIKVDWLDKEIKEEVQSLLDYLEKADLLQFIELDLSIVRGFDYYTGFIFEIFDTNPENRRSLYGGGRYDNLIGIFSNEELSGIGFGLGDVTLLNFLKSHSLLPSMPCETQVFIPLFDSNSISLQQQIAKHIRTLGISVETGLIESKLAKVLTYAEKKQFLFVILIGEIELQKNEVQIKTMSNRTQESIPVSEIGHYLKNKLNQ